MPRMSTPPPKIRVVGDPVLATPTRQVTEFDAALATLIDQMFASLAVAEGVGLAAPQIGVDLAVFVYDCPDGSGGRARGHVVNPTIETSGEPDLSDEGCLSVPGPYYELERAWAATVRGVDKDAKPVEVSGTGYLARCLQHETDHLRGVLYIDHLPRNRRRRVLRDMEPFPWNETG
ncbi:MAG: peptide deformylase [Pseudonocardiales bacterium]|jgi:peptide deformylase|nr:def2 [Jatrophihabitans sp.]MDT4950267.1 peptide deformylase [Pseudonocardiales bacterium]